MSGLTDFNTGDCILAPNLGWRDVPVGNLLSKQLGVDVFVHNLGEVVAMAEMIEGAARGSDDVVLLYAGTGVGAGILIDGRIFHGFNGIAGEIGHCRVESATELCSCGKVGCLETIASVRALQHFVRERLARGEESVLSEAAGHLTPHEVGAAAKAGDVVAREAINAIGRNLGLAASWLVNLYDPEVLVVGGGLSDLGELLIAPLREAAQQFTLCPGERQLRVEASALGQDAEVRGAILVALQQVEKYYRAGLKA